MKKVLFIAMLVGIADFASAKENVEKVNSKAKEIKVIKSTKETKKKFQTECGVFQASCISAYTCQDWNPAQWHHWMVEIQNNYCELNW